MGRLTVGEFWNSQKPVTGERCTGCTYRCPDLGVIRKEAENRKRAVAVMFRVLGIKGGCRESRA